ncbi:uncharacterized mitochondrial protein-like protein [Tanacetum coccineum]
MQKKKKKEERPNDPPPTPEPNPPVVVEVPKDPPPKQLEKNASGNPRPAVLPVPKRTKLNPVKPAAPPKPTPVPPHVVPQPQPVKMLENGVYTNSKVRIIITVNSACYKQRMGMCVGEKCKLKIPSKRSYGECGSPPKIPEVKTTNTSIETQKPLLKNEDGEEVDVHLYRSMIGSLMYLTSSRPNIMFAVCACARYQVNPNVSHLHAVKRIFRYLKGQPNLGLWYPKDSHFDLVAYTNSDYVGASLDRKSTTGGCQFLGFILIS